MNDAPPPSRWLVLVGVSLAAFVGCFAGSQDSSGLDDDYMDDPPPPGGCATECPSPGSDGSPLGGPCVDSDDCMEGAVCIAPFDGEVDAFTCQDTCVPLMDETQWCADDSSCCTAGAFCSSRGFCLMPEDTGGVDESGSTSGGGTTAATDDGSSDTGATGTDSGGATSTGAGSSGSSTG